MFSRFPRFGRRFTSIGRWLRNFDRSYVDWTVVASIGRSLHRLDVNYIKLTVIASIGRWFRRFGCGCIDFTVASAIGWSLNLDLAVVTSA